MKKQTKVEVDSAFLDRSVNYCENEEELENLLSVIKPQWVCMQMFYSGDVATSYKKAIENNPTISKKKKHKKSKKK